MTGTRAANSEYASAVKTAERAPIRNERTTPGPKNRECLTMADYLINNRVKKHCWCQEALDGTLLTFKFKLLAQVIDNAQVMSINILPWQYNTYAFSLVFAPP